MKFSFDTIQDFDSHILKSIPDYDKLMNLVLNISEYFLLSDSNVYDIGCSTGKLLKSIQTDKKINRIGIDYSENLLPKSDDIKFLNIDLNKPFTFNNASIVYSIFTMQFIEKRNRLNLITSIYDGLLDGSIFILAEKVYSDYPIIQDMNTFLYYDFKKENFTNDEILNKEKDLRSIMRLNTSKENDNLLKSKFKIVETFWKHLNFEAKVCIK